nr:uncharacterized protein LOC128690312 [Cherax quadricarinatus]XP_053634946.1 uncharacterized protein LOC128690312 [Cherax quadricarinatus]
MTARSEQRPQLLYSATYESTQGSRPEKEGSTPGEGAAVTPSPTTINPVGEEGEGGEHGPGSGDEASGGGVCRECPIIVTTSAINTGAATSSAPLPPQHHFEQHHKHAHIKDYTTEDLEDASFVLSALVAAVEEGNLPGLEKLFILHKTLTSTWRTSMEKVLSTSHVVWDS